MCGWCFSPLQCTGLDSGSNRRSPVRSLCNFLQSMIEEAKLDAMSLILCQYR